MADCKGEVLGTPGSIDGVEVAGTDAAALDFDVYIIVAKRFWLELVFVKVLPRLRAVDLEASKLVGVSHGYEASALRIGQIKRRISKKESKD